MNSILAWVRVGRTPFGVHVVEIGSGGVTHLNRLPARVWTRLGVWTPVDEGLLSPNAPEFDSGGLRCLGNQQLQVAKAKPPATTYTKAHLRLCRTQVEEALRLDGPERAVEIYNSFLREGVRFHGKWRRAFLRKVGATSTMEVVGLTASPSGLQPWSKQVGVTTPPAEPKGPKEVVAKATPPLQPPRKGSSRNGRKPKAGGGHLRHLAARAGRSRR
jgi:hypothetical protein